MEVAHSESQATLHPLFSHTLNGVERGGLSIMQSLSIRYCSILLHTRVMCITLKSDFIESSTTGTKCIIKQIQINVSATI